MWLCNCCPNSGAGSGSAVVHSGVQRVHVRVGGTGSALLRLCSRAGSAHEWVLLTSGLLSRAGSHHGAMPASVS